MARSPLVSLTIPTLNSGRTLALCLEAATRQTYPQLEVVVVDGRSTDGSPRIAERYGARVLTCSGGLLEARLRGLRASRGEYVVLLDADQVLAADAVERAVRRAEADGYDMLVLEERSWPRCRGLVPALYRALREVVNRRLGEAWALEPGRGLFVPRFFRRGLLEQAFGAIPAHLVPQVVHYDHDIIYYECWRLSRRVGVIRGALYHVEPDWEKLWRKNLRYGASLNTLARDGRYGELLRRGEARLYFGRPLRLGVPAFLLTLILKAAQWVGRAAYSQPHAALNPPAPTP